MEKKIVGICLGVGFFSLHFFFFFCKIFQSSKSIFSGKKVSVVPFVIASVMSILFFLDSLCNFIKSLYICLPYLLAFSNHLKLFICFP